MNVLAYAAVGLIVIFILVKCYPYLYLIAGARGEISKMNKTCLDTGMVVPQIAAARDGHANIYLIREKNGYIAIDGGEKAKVLAPALAELSIRPEEVTTVFLTHSDFDHCGAVKLFKSAHVYLAKAEEQLVNGSTPRTFSKYRLKWKNKLPVPYTTLDDGDILTIGERKVQCILTPGHTPGSMCFLIDDKYLFTGDTVVLETGRFKRFVELFTMDGDENVKSIHTLVDKVAGKNIAYVFSAHHGFTDDYSLAAEWWGNTTP
jgi:glyoxylase-like metal-dependent hydrolase (beta-lactamase superfamily II)